MHERLDVALEELHMDAGQALAAGKLTLTIRSLLTDQHVTLRMTAKAKTAGRWRATPFHLAQRVFIDVPSEWGDSVATYHVTGSGAGVLRAARGADSSRYWCALYALRWVCGRDVSYAPHAEVILSSWCLRCGAELTEPESVEANMGPVCRRIVSEEYGKRHQQKVVTQDADPEPVVMAQPRLYDQADAVESLRHKRPGESLASFLDRIERG